VPETYRIIIQPEAYEGMVSGYALIEQGSPESASQWALGLMDAISSLATFPARCPLAPESRHFRREIRQLLYGKGRNAYRILFTIADDVVSVLHIRHGAMETLKPNAGQLGT
jgi:plasmid stabilization system protein ParE